MVTDFGLAKWHREGTVVTRTGQVLGTPNYMSPEQILGRELTPQSDFYSLATVLFELLTGKQLFKARKVKDLFRMVVHQKPPALTTIRPDFPDGLAEMMARALAKKPTDRFQTGAEMAKAMQPFLKTFKTVEQRPLPQLRLITQYTRSRQKHSKRQVHPCAQRWRLPWRNRIHPWHGRATGSHGANRCKRLGNHYRSTGSASAESAPALLSLHL